MLDHWFSVCNQLNIQEMSQMCMQKNIYTLFPVHVGARVCAYPLGALSCMCKITAHFEASLKNKTGHIRAQYL